MRQKHFLFSIFFIHSIWMVAQVGINNQNPSATLDVSGDVLVRGKLFLENPGIYTQASDSELLVIKESDGAVVKYDIANSVYGPLNYVQFVFQNTAREGLRDGYDTQISTEKYTLAVHGFYIKVTGTDNTGISLRTSRGNSYIEGPQFYAYAYNDTWWIKGFVNSSQFYETNAIKYVDIFMNVMIYRNNFVTKTWETIQVVDMGKEDTKTVPLPSGF